MSSGTENSAPKIKAAVIGWPIAQSRSPLIHNFWLQQFNIQGTYEAIAVRPDELVQRVRELKTQGYVGANVTVPHKQSVTQICDQLDQAAQQIGAVNTLVFGPHTIKGMNTDAFGFSENLKSTSLDWNRKTALVLGAGGAARAVLYALNDLGIKHIYLQNRTEARAQEVAQDFDAFNCTITVLPWAEHPAVLEACDLVVNTTSLGMIGSPPLKLHLQGLKPTALVHDLVYNPLQTDLLRTAADQDHPTLDGIGMLLHQARPGFQAWYGAAPEVTDQLRAKIIASLEAP